MAEWVIVNGHVLDHCSYLRSLNEPWEPYVPCDCRDLQDSPAEDPDEDDYGWGSGDLAYEGSW